MSAKRLLFIFVSTAGDGGEVADEQGGELKEEVNDGEGDTFINKSQV